MPTEADLIADVAARAARAAASWREGARLSGVRPLTGGASSLTFLADVAGVPEHEATVVLKVAPPGLAPVRNRDVLRQGRVMRALHGRPGIRVPAVLFDDAGAPPDVPPLVGMGFVPGICREPGLEADRPSSQFAEVRSSALDCARMLGAIHRLVPADIGLAAEPVVTLADEIDRWTRAFETVPADLQGAYAACAEALHATMPEPMPPVINHGDYRVGNTLVAGGKVQAVIDWEIWSLGDPRIDITWLAFFTDEAKHAASPNDAPTGMPSARELEQTYLAERGGTLPDLGWFDALTRYKEAAATALLIKRARKSADRHDSFARMEPALPALLRQAHELVGR
ncbi:MAG: phosphotransferase family protein [Frankiales bacterium]|nr:phosphotransferase family protein [Frankiales bacterium]